MPSLRGGALRRGTAAVWTSLGEYFGEFFTDDAVLHFAGNNAMSGTYRGRDTVMDTLGRLIQGWGPHHVEVEAVLASDDHVISFYHVISEHHGKTLDVVMAQPMKVNAEGKISEGWFLASDQRGFDQFWS